MLLLVFSIVIGGTVALWLIYVTYLAKFWVRNTPYYNAAFAFIKSNTFIADQVGVIKEVIYQHGPGTLWGNTITMRFVVCGSRSIRVRITLETTSPLNEDWKVIFAKMINDRKNDEVFYRV